MIKQSQPLSRLITAFGLALVASLAAGALVAGSAFALSLEPGPGPFTTSSEATTFSMSTGEQWSCSGKGSGSGSFTTGTSGSATFTFTKCEYQSGGFPVTCTTAGQPAGTIKTSTLGVSPVYLDAAKTKFGLLLSPPESGVFAEFKCAGFINKVWKGSLIGEITKPALNVSAYVHVLTFNQFGSGVQQYTQIEGSGPKYQLTQGGVNVALGATQNMTFVQSKKYIP